MNWSVHCADVLDWCAEYEGEKFHAVLTDPPYHLYSPSSHSGTQPTGGVYGRINGGSKGQSGGFMGKKWDGGSIAFDSTTWAAIAEHLHSGGFILAFGGSRTYHRLAVAAEDAGLIIHPALSWLNGQGFPKATRIDTQIDKAAGAEREVVGTVADFALDGAQRDASKHRNTRTVTGFAGDMTHGWDRKITAPATPLAAAWAGHRYGLQALKPCAEFILCAQKPYVGKPVDCITSTGAGALWIDGARVATDWDTDPTRRGWQGKESKSRSMVPDTNHKQADEPKPKPINGRWPPNVLLSHIAPILCSHCGGTGFTQVVLPGTGADLNCEVCRGSGVERPGCERRGVKRVRGSSQDTGLTNTPARSWKNSSIDGINRTGYTAPDGTEAVADWACVDGCPVAELSAQSGERKSGKMTPAHNRNSLSMYGQGNGHPTMHNTPGDKGTAARFYPQFSWQYEIEERLAGVVPFRYQAKAGRKERSEGLNDFYWRKDKDSPIGFVRISHEEWESLPEKERAQGNIHPTQKPIELCKFLATLLLPPIEYAPRRILIPFFGKGSEGAGAGLAGWEEIVGIEKEPDYCEAGRARLDHWLKHMQMELNL